MGPERTCIGCRCVRPAAEMVRYVLDDGGSVQCGHGLPGRGAWICPDQECVRAAVAKSASSRAFRTSVNPEATRHLLNRIEQ